MDTDESIRAYFRKKDEERLRKSVKYKFDHPHSYHANLMLSIQAMRKKKAAKKERMAIARKVLTKDKIEQILNSYDLKAIEAEYKMNRLKRMR